MAPALGANRSLGEFAHATPTRVRWSGARATLSQLQQPSTNDLSEAGQTTRGSTLNAVAFAFGLEVKEQAKRRYPFLAAALESVLPYDDLSSVSEIEEWLERCWRKRGADFGTPDFLTSQPQSSAVFDSEEDQSAGS